MKIYTSRAVLSKFLLTQQSSKKSVGLVPTMGALHKGHLSLIKAAKLKNELVVCSIFVNPTQFSDPVDLAKYPRQVESDIEKLKVAGCDILFLPEVSEMYSKDEKWHIDLNGLDQILEGLVRPGHYQGVTQIVKKLFDTVKPDTAFFGQKDYQQYMVISEMVRQYSLPLQLIMCPIIREEDGLAMSSRNIYLSEDQHREALALNKGLQLAASLFSSSSILEIKKKVLQFLKNEPGITLEYFEICDSKTLKTVEEKKPGNLVALIAARIGSIRLIDNILLG
ncbi:MAG: pantoate--beta-alanine ligase [Flavobacterium sp.]|nr:pantoate--beta-alanine ligase [Pedobacter sp.]